MIVRFFGGWDFVASDAATRSPAVVGYHKGVPMGGDPELITVWKDPACKLEICECVETAVSATKSSYVRWKSHITSQPLVHRVTSLIFSKGDVSRCGILVPKLSVCVKTQERVTLSGVEGCYVQ
jgi:hypothetical protein